MLLQLECTLWHCSPSLIALYPHFVPHPQAVSQDVRPEVRNSGVRTLFAVVVNQGPRLSRALWEQCLWEMLFPLLSHAYLMSATASRDEVRAGRGWGWWNHGKGATARWCLATAGAMLWRLLAQDDCTIGCTCKHQPPLLHRPLVAKTPALVQ